MTAARTLLLALAAMGLADAQPFDLVIRGGRIVDVSGSPWYSGDLGLRGGKIAATARLDGAAAKRTIEARGMVVAGFH